MRERLAAFTLATILLGPALPLPAVEFVPDKILLELNPATKVHTLDAFRQKLAATTVQLSPSGRHAVVTLDKGANTRAAATMAKSVHGVLLASPIAVYTIKATPNDPLFTVNQWSFHNTGGTVSFPDPGDPQRNIVLTGVPDADIDMPEAWDITTGSASVVVAVIDTGFPIGNADLMPNIWINTDEIPNNGIDDDANGYVDDIHGYNFFSNTNSVMDDHGHGSFCSGIIGARGNDGVGMVGINWNVRIMGLKAFDSTGSSTDAELVLAIDYAVNNGANIINASWGDYWQSPILVSAIKRASDAGVLFVAASGNDKYNMRETPMYPAALSVANLLSVGATDIRDRWADFSNFDGTMVDCHAPGYWVYSARPTKYEFASGTSFAAPHVAGVAALLLAHEPTITMDQMRARLLMGYDPRMALQGRGVTGGRTSAHKVLTAASADTLPPETITNFRLLETASNGFEVAFTAPADAELYDVRLSTQPIDDTNFFEATRIHEIPKPAAAGTMQRFFATALEPDTAYHLRIRTYDAAGNWSLSNPLSANTAGRTIYFADDAESDTGLWTPTGSFARTNSEAHRGEWSWTDSPDGDYIRNTTATLTSIPIDLTTATSPWLTFHHHYILTRSFTSVGANVSVQASTDGVTYTTLSQHLDFRHPFHMVRVSLAEYAGQPALRLRFRFRSDISVRVADGWYIDDIEVADFAAYLPERTDIVVESATRVTTVTPAPAYLETSVAGSWFTSQNKPALPQVRGSRSRYKIFGTPGSTATFTPQFDADGRYEVFVAWGDNANAANVTHRIRHAHGEATLLLTQDSRTNGHQWHSLGTYEFRSGLATATGSVSVEDATVTGAPDATAEGRVYADAVRFLWRGPSGGPASSWVLE